VQLELLPQACMPSDEHTVQVYPPSCRQRYDILEKSPSDFARYNIVAAVALACAHNWIKIDHSLFELILQSVLPGRTTAGRHGLH
jgi:hypothetical protein